MDFNKDDILAVAHSNEIHADRILSTAIDCAWNVIAEAVSATKAAMPLVQSKGTEEDITLHLMCVNALSDVVAALMNIRQGFARPPAVTLRGVVENLAGVVAFRYDADLMAQFLKDDYPIQKAVNPAKKHFPALGILYGEFTQIFTHETYQTLGRNFTKLETGVALTLVPYVIKPEHCGPSMKLLVRLAQVAHIAGQITEACFFPRLIQESRYWECENNKLIPKTTNGKTAIDKLIAEFEEFKTRYAPTFNLETNILT